MVQALPTLSQLSKKLSVSFLSNAPGFAPLKASYNPNDAQDRKQNQRAQYDASVEGQKELTHSRLQSSG
jgi:hypothetical protein